MSRRLLLCLTFSVAAMFGCERRSQPPPNYNQCPPGRPCNQGPGGPGGQGPGQPWGPQPPPPPGGGPYTGPQPPPPNIPSGPLPPVFNDPINGTSIVWMRQRAQEVIGELKAALPANYGSQVQAVPLVVDDTPGDVNAFAACIDGKALMAITDGLLEIQSQMARSRATDDIYGTRKFDQYIQFIAQNQKPEQPIVKPPAGFFDPTQDVDGRKVARQHDLFDEMTAFVLGHELAHHYLQHTGCVGGGGNPFLDLGRVASHVVPGFNQPNELASDNQGVQNTLGAGARRQGYKWTEGGAYLVLDFFQAVTNITPGEAILFAFELSHPPPAVRRPMVQQAAANWRQGGGAQTSPFPFPFPLPGFPQ